MMLKKVDDLNTCDKWLEQCLSFDRQSVNMCKAAYVYHKWPVGQFISFYKISSTSANKNSPIKEKMVTDISFNQGK